MPSIILPALQIMPPVLVPAAGGMVSNFSSRVGKGETKQSDTNQRKHFETRLPLQGTYHSCNNSVLILKDPAQ